MTRTIETLDALTARIAAEDARKYDVIADTRRMSISAPVSDFTDNGTILTLDTDDGLGEFKLTDHALGQISTDLGIPKRYFDRMQVDAPDLFRDNVHHWFQNEPKARLVRGLTNGDDLMTGRGWMSDRFRRLDHIEIARTLLPEFEKLGMPVEFHQAAITESKLYVRALFPMLERDVKAVGDTVRWGVSITNSEIGGGSLTISSFVLRLACTNGMVADKVLNARHVGKREDAGVLSNEALAADDVAFWLAARDELRALCTEAAFQTVIDKLEGLSDERVVSPVAATKVLANEFSLTEAEEEAVMLTFAGGAQNAGNAQWGMLNAVTAVAKQAESFDRQAELEGIGWNIAEMTAPSWERVALAVR
jgi:hypothetical protein